MSLTFFSEMDRLRVPQVPVLDLGISKCFVIGNRGTGVFKNDCPVTAIGASIPPQVPGFQTVKVSEIRLLRKHLCRVMQNAYITLDRL